MVHLTLSPETMDKLAAAACLNGHSIGQEISDRVKAIVQAREGRAEGMALSSPGKRIRGRRGVELRERRMARSKWLCEDCQAQARVTAATVVDHIKPLALGGEDIDENTRNLCDPCHEKRTAEQFGRRVRQSIGLDGWPA